MNENIKKTLKEFLNPSHYHWHFKIIGYMEKSGDNLLESTEITIIDAGTEEEAIEMAKRKIKRPYYFLKEAWQCKSCVNQELYNKLIKKQLGDE